MNVMTISPDPLNQDKLPVLLRGGKSDMLRLSFISVLVRADESFQSGALAPVSRDDTTKGMIARN